MRKIALLISFIMAVLGIIFFPKEHQSKLKKDVVNGNKQEVKIYFLNQSEFKQRIFLEDSFRLGYELYLVDDSRPLQKGKLIEKRNHLTEKDAYVFKTGSLLPGIEKALLQMSKESEAWVYIPWQLAFGEKGAGDGLVPPKQDLVAIIKVTK